MARRRGRPAFDPDRISLTDTLNILRCRLTEAPANPRRLKAWYEALVEEVADEIPPPRRNRINPRVSKQKMSNWAKKNAHHRNPPQPSQPFRNVVDVLR